NIIDFLILEAYDLFGGGIPFHTLARLERKCTHVRGYSLLESFFDTATWLAAVADATQPFPHVQVGGVDPFAVAIGKQQPLVGEIPCRGRGHAIKSFCLGIVAVQRHVLGYEAILYPVGISR